MSNLIVVAGYISPGREGLSKVLNLDGMQFEVKNEAIAKQFPLDTTQNGAVRMFIEPDAELSVSAKASALHLLNNVFRPNFMKKIAHWVDVQKEFDPPYDIPHKRPYTDT